MIIWPHEHSGSLQVQQFFFILFSKKKYIILLESFSQTHEKIRTVETGMMMGGYDMWYAAIVPIFRRPKIHEKCLVINLARLAAGDSNLISSAIITNWVKFSVLSTDCLRCKILINYFFLRFWRKVNEIRHTKTHHGTM